MLQCSEAVDARHDAQTAIFGFDIVEWNPNRDVRLRPLEVVAVVLMQRERCSRSGRAFVDGLIEVEPGIGPDEVATDVDQWAAAREISKQATSRNEVRRVVDDVGMRDPRSSCGLLAEPIVAHAFEPIDFVFHGAK
jgi:hypothetical protein